MTPDKTTVVNLRIDRYDVYIGRGSLFGNPIRLHSKQQRGSTLAKFKEYFYKRLSLDEGFKNEVLKLKGLRLGCFCQPQPCHGDIIADYLNKELDS
jgi:hypothetical protein